MALNETLEREELLETFRTFRGIADQYLADGKEVPGYVENGRFALFEQLQ